MRPLIEMLAKAAHVKKSRHLVICGCSRSGTTMLYGMVRSSASDAVFSPPLEMRASRTKGLSARYILTKRPLDILDTERIERELGKQRDIWFLACVRDPRDLVSSFHTSIPNQFFQGADYQFFVSGTKKSLAYPGVAAIFEALSKANEEDSHRVFTSRYEDVVRDPDELRKIIRFATGFPLIGSFEDLHAKQLDKGLAAALNGKRPVEMREVPAWTKPERLERAYRQVTLFPVLEEIASAWGYPTFEDVVEKNSLTLPRLDTPQGTIVAFHTDDALYRAEAKRFLRSVERLGLPVDMQVVPPRAEWVANCAMKPEIIADARRRLTGPLLYIDVDAVVHSDPWPYLAQYDADIAVNILPNGTLNSGTIWVADTDGARSVLDEWIAHQKTHPDKWDQVTLQKVIEASEAKKSEPKFIAQRIPHNYCYIFDRDYKYTAGEIVIEQLQASRASEAKWGRKADNKAKTRSDRVAELESKLW